MWTTLFGFVLSKAPWLAASWVKPVCYALVASTLVWSGWHLHGWKYDSDQVEQVKQQLQDQHDADVKQHADDIKQHNADEAIIATAAQDRDKYKQQSDELTLKLGNKTFTESVAPAKVNSHDEHPSTAQPDCPVLRRNITYWLCYNAAVTGDAESRAACEAD